MKEKTKSGSKTVIKQKSSYPSRYSGSQEKTVIKQKPTYPSRYK